MSFNPDLLKQAMKLIHSKKGVEVDHSEIRFNNIPLITVDEHKTSWIILDSNSLFSTVRSNQLYLKQGKVNYVVSMVMFITPV